MAGITVQHVRLHDNSLSVAAALAVRVYEESVMMTKMLFPVAMLAAGLMAASADANAAQGRKKSLLTGAAVGVAAGAAGAYMLGKSSSGAQAQEAQEPRYTNSARPARYSKTAEDDEEECSVKKVDLFDRKGNFVKSERMRVCE